jgi:hypothetical protein
MGKHRTLLVLALILALQPKAAAPPSFDQFRVDEVFRGRPARPLRNTRDARLFRTRIAESAKKGPNFAGKYTIAQWGCGTSCIDIALIDEETGTVYDGPIRFLQYDGSMQYPDGSYSLSDDSSRSVTSWTAAYLLCGDVQTVIATLAVRLSIMSGKGGGSG